MHKIRPIIALFRFQFYRLFHLKSLVSGSMCRTGPGFSLSISGSCILGKEVVFGRKVLFDVRGNLEIGDHTFFNDYVRIICHEQITIGRNVLFGAYVSVYDHDHAFKINRDELEFSDFRTSPVHIGNNVWIGEKVCVLKGVQIGSNVVIGAGSVVTGNIPSNVMAAGNPCKVIKNLD